MKKRARHTTVVVAIVMVVVVVVMAGGGDSHPRDSNPPVSARLATVSLTKAYATIYSHFSPRPLPGIFLRSVTISELSEFMPTPSHACPSAPARVLGYSYPLHGNICTVK